MSGPNLECVIVCKLKLSAIGLSVFIGLVGCGPSDDSQSDDSSGSGGVAGGFVGGAGATTSSGSTGGGGANGGTGGSSPIGGVGGDSTGGDTATGGHLTGGNSSGGVVPTGGRAGDPTGGSGGNSGGSGPSGGRPSGGTGGGPTGGLGPLGGRPTGGSGGNPTGGFDPIGGGGTGGAGGDPAGGAAGDTGGTEPTGGASTPGCTPPTEYPNLFVTVSGHTQEESDAKVQAAWNQLYNPSNNNTVYYNGPGGDESYVKDTGNNDVRSEGMSYGMMTAVQLDKQTEFDRLWAWVKNHMANGTGQITWQCSSGGQKMASGGAPDGEEYMATALIFAQNRWGDSGRFDYAAEAQWVLNLIRKTYFNAQYHLVQFVANSGNTDASYVLPAFYQVWACFDTENADFWKASVEAGRNFFHAAADQNGVIGDRQSFTGQTQMGAGSDAKRCVMNIMMDHNFFAADSWQSETYAPAFGNYMRTHSDGSAAQFSCNALLGFGLPESSGKAFVDKLWQAQIPTGQWRYYDGTLYMLGLLHVSGTFKLYY